MKKILYILLALSVIVNIYLLFGQNFSSNQAKAEKLMKNIVCEDLKYPDSYDPIYTELDSAFSGYMTDEDCINTASNLNDLEDSFFYKKNRYKERWRELFTPNDTAFDSFSDIQLSEWRDLKKSLEKIFKERDKIRKRDKSKDGNFIGWWIKHKYRYKTKYRGDYNIQIETVKYFVNPDIDKSYSYFSMNDDYNEYEKIKEKIEDIVGTIKY